MYLYPNIPDRLYRRLFDDLRVAGLQNTVPAWTPRVDVKEEAARYVVYFDVPGIDPQDIEIQAERNQFVVKGERKREAAAEGENFSRIERVHGAFERRFSLPETADADAITATGRNGVLEISIPKKPQSQPRKIRVGVNPLDGADEAPQSVQ